MYKRQHVDTAPTVTVAIRTAPLLVSDLEHADRADEVKRRVRYVDIRSVLDKLQCQGRFRDRDERYRLTAYSDVEQALYRFRLAPETHPHRTIPDLQRRLNRPWRDASNEDRPCASAFGRSRPVSYTHLDVYKRQGLYSHLCAGAGEMMRGWLRSDGRKGIRNVVAVAYLSLIHI